ncbi:MAG: SRPBCC family protein [Candidatus Eremiobacterota bacterium]
MGDLVMEFDPAVPVDRAWTPPARWYRDPEVLELERARIFRNSWQAVARLDQLSQPGSFATADVAGEPVVVLRDEQGQLRALSNVCRHHAACVASGEGQAEELVCPYHGWSYHLDGRLKRAPRLGAARDFRREDFALPTFPVGTFGPLVFVHLGRPKRSLAEVLAPLAGMSGLAELRFVTRRTYDLDCNWKVFVDNYLDGGYHVAHLHHDLAANLDLEGYRTEVHGEVSLQCCGGGRDERVGREATYAFVYPNLMLNRYGPWLDTNLVLPLSPTRCRTVFDYYVEPDRMDPAFVEESLKASDQVQQEDIDICHSVQRGLGSEFYDRGRYAPAIEHADHHFHCLLARDLG